MTLDASDVPNGSAVFGTYDGVPPVALSRSGRVAVVRQTRRGFDLEVYTRTLVRAGRGLRLGFLTSGSPRVATRWASPLGRRTGGSMTCPSRWANAVSTAVTTRAP